MQSGPIVRLAWPPCSRSRPRAQLVAPSGLRRSRSRCPPAAQLAQTGPLVLARDMLSSTALPRAARRRIPRPLPLPVTLWSEGGFGDQIERLAEYDVLVTYIAMEKKYQVVQVMNDRPLSLGKFDRVEDAEARDRPTDACRRSRAFRSKQAVLLSRDARRAILAAHRSRRGESVAQGRARAGDPRQARIRARRSRGASACSPRDCSVATHASSRRQRPTSGCRRRLARRPGDRILAHPFLRSASECFRCRLTRLLRAASSSNASPVGRPCSRPARSPPRARRRRRRPSRRPTTSPGSSRSRASTSRCSTRRGSTTRFR